MATAAPDVHLMNGSAPSPDSTEQLEAFAHRHGWTVDQAVRTALKIADIVLESNEEPGSKTYVYRGGKRYALEIKQ